MWQRWKARVNCAYNRFSTECKTRVVFSHAFDYKEEKAVEILMRKILSKDKEDYFIDEYRLCLL